jgi:hypothetical protein
VNRHAQRQAWQADNRADQPPARRRARRNTARNVSAVRIANGEQQGWPPWVVWRRERVVGKPNGQAATLTQAGLVDGPIGDTLLPPRDVVAAILV